MKIYTVSHVSDLGPLKDILTISLKSWNCALSSVVRGGVCGESVAPSATVLKDPVSAGSVRSVGSPPVHRGHLYPM